ncbi:CCR4-NOT transcription complex subunit 6-like [Diadema antillarum]|uniref:CCR4-NOT transcription complex subunit 6-like n=1 Tax=Diadema antillarum TaxID=105358 RepID=UPI003A84498B
MPKDKYDKDKYDNHGHHNGISSHKGQHNGLQRGHRIMSQEEVMGGKKSHWEGLELTGTIRNISPQLWKLNHLTQLYMTDNQLTRVPADICQLTHLIKLDLSYNKLRSLPVELGDLISLRELFLNNNQLRLLPFELGRLFNLQVLGLNGNPLASEILGLYNEPKGIQKLLSYMLDHIHPPAIMPPARPWIHISHPSRDKAAAIFSVMSYNVLCDKYATKQIYAYCPTWALEWEYRRKGIMDEILSGSSDIICLQEVETEQYYSFFSPTLKQQGYDSVFSPKSRAKTMSEEDRKYVDGCAIFFRTSKFALVKEHLVEFNQLAMANAEGSEDMLNRVMTKDNIGLAVLLETREGCYEGSAFHQEAANARQQLLVANVHIHWDPEFSDVKLIQTMMFMNELKKIIEEESVSFRPGGGGGGGAGASSSQRDSGTIPLVLCGDLNSLPDSGVVEYLEMGKISVRHPDFKDLNYKVLRNFSSNSEANGHISHSFQLKRVYQNNPMRFTNYTFDFKGIIDYIFFSRQAMSVLGLLGPMDHEWIDTTKVMGCPNASIPSDHFSLLTEFEMPLPTSPSTPPSSGLYHPTPNYPLARR